MKSKITEKQAKKALKKLGYQVANLWHVDDVHQAMYDRDEHAFPDKIAMEIIEQALVSESVYSAIWESISQIIDDKIKESKK